MVFFIYHMFTILDIMSETDSKQKTTKKWIFEIDTRLDQEFREAIGQNKGARRGVIKETLEEAITEWIKNHKK